MGDNNRVAIISVKEGRFGSSEVLISVSPYTEDFENKVADYINDKYLEIEDWKEDWGIISNNNIVRGVLLSGAPDLSSFNENLSAF